MKYVENNTIFLKSPKGTSAVFLVSENRCHYCPLLEGNSFTGNQIARQDLDHITLAFYLMTFFQLPDMEAYQEYFLFKKLRKSHLFNNH